MSKVLLQCKHPLILAQKILGQRAVKFYSGPPDRTVSDMPLTWRGEDSSYFSPSFPPIFNSRIHVSLLSAYGFRCTSSRLRLIWFRNIPKHDYPLWWQHQTNCLSSWNWGSKEAICWVCIKRQFDSGSSPVYGVQKVASVQNCTELVTIPKTIRKQGWISFYQTILWSPWRNVQCRASGQAAWAFRVTAAKQRHVEGFEDWSNNDSSKVVKWWKLNPFISSYLFHVLLFPIVSNYTYINTTHQRASAEDRLSYGLQVVLCLLLWCFGVSAVPIYAKRIFDGSFGVKKLLGNGVLPCDTRYPSN